MWNNIECLPFCGLVCNSEFFDYIANNPHNLKLNRSLRPILQRILDLLDPHVVPVLAKIVIGYIAVERDDWRTEYGIGYQKNGIKVGYEELNQ